MSTISSTSSVSSVSSATANAQSQVQQAAQSIISGSTGNSSMDVSTLVAALVNAKTAGQAAALKTKQTNDNTTLSAYGALTSALSALQAALKNLSDGTTLSTFAATASGKGMDPKAGSGAQHADGEDEQQLAIPDGAVRWREERRGAGHQQVRRIDGASPVPGWRAANVASER